MPEAEDVLLHAAEQVTAVARGLWLRHHPSAELPGIALVEVSRRLSLVLQACIGRTWPILPIDPDPTPAWLAKRLRKLPPWAHAAHAHACTDGRSLFLPRHLQVCGDAGELLRLMALILAARLARGSVQHCPLEPVARDLFWAIDGTVIEALLAAQFPGLAAPIAAARRRTLASRPTRNALTPRERAVEQLV
jgi:nitric oxide reductase NorD protein